MPLAVTTRGRLLASAIHLGLSLAVAACAAALVFGLWYPGAYRSLSDGVGLFRLVVAVDVVLGPLLTLVVFDVRKPRRELARDLAVIAALQVAALGYGLWTVAQARPVHLVHEVDRFRVVSAADIEPAALADAPPGLRRLPWTGPTVIAARRARTGDETLEGVMSAAAGVEISMLPARWVPYDAGPRAEAWARAIELAAAQARWPEARRDDLRRAADAIAARAGLAPAQVRLLPVVSRFASWSVVVGPDGEPVGFLPVDAF